MTEDRYTKAMQEHDAIWAPILAAHRVAAALRSQADLFASLSAEAKDAWIPGLSKIPDEWAAHLRRQADAIELASPLPVTPTEEDYEALFQAHYDACCDSRPKDMAHAWLDQMTEAEKVEEIARTALEDLLDTTP